MSYYTIIPLVSLMVNVFTSAYIFAKNPRAPLNRSYLIWNLAVTLWLFCEVFMWSAISLDMVLIFGRIAAIGWLAVGFLFLNFVYQLVGRRHDLIWWLTLALLLCSWVILFSTDWIVAGAVTYFWGSNLIGGELYTTVINLMIAAPMGFALILLVLDYRKRGREYRAHLPIVIGGTLMLLSGIISDYIIPEIFGIKNMISLAPNVTVIISISILVAIRKYGIMIDVTTIAREMLSNVSEGIVLVTASGRIELINGAAQKLLGESCSIGSTLSNYLDNYEIGAKSDEVESFVSVSETPVTYTQSPVKQWGVLSGYLVIIRDMSRRLKLESEMVKRQKLESVGILAGGIAHDFNNVLTSLIGSISLSKNLVGEAHPSWPVLARAEEATLQSKQLTRQLVTFAKGGEPVKKPLSLVSLVKSAVHFSLSGSNVTYVFDYPENLDHVLGDDGQLRQVISNLVLNAKEAMASGGVIEIEAANLSLRRPRLQLPKGKYIILSFRDYGEGIAEENLTRIFDPYFTTKSQGTGLGLYSAYSIIKKHGGTIVAESKEGIGTTFKVFLPAAGRAAAEEKKITLLPTSRGGRLLFMDDEELIFLTTGKLLESAGYHVIYAPDGQVAFEKYRTAKENGTPFDLIIMDLTIQGGMGGEECIKHIKEYDPQAKAIISSGYSDNPVMANYASYGFSGVIVKPYKYTELITLMDEVLQ